MKDTDISNINLKKGSAKIIMKHRSILIYCNLAYVTGSIFFFILFFYNIQIIILTNLIIIMSIALLLVKLLYWYSIRKPQRRTKGIDKQKSFLLRLTFCIFTYITPVYCIIQEQHLVVSHYVSTVTFIIVTVLAIIGIFIERWLSFMESQHSDSLYDGNNAI